VGFAVIHRRPHISEDADVRADNSRPFLGSRSLPPGVDGNLSGRAPSDGVAGVEQAAREARFS